MKCPHCNQEHPDNFQFCPIKGVQISFMKACMNPKCGNYGLPILPSDAFFCPECGHPIDEKQEECSDKIDFTVESITFTMIRVEGGTFMMGASDEQEEPDKDEKPVHEVTLSSYYIGETPVTQALWKAVMGRNPSHFEGEDLPVENVSWSDCQTFIKELNQKVGKSFRLPTEAEWEFAGRGGNKSKGYQYSGSNNIGDVAWRLRNSWLRTHPVKSKTPNELGIYDMSGNVNEWCQDWYEHYSSNAQTNPTGPSSGSYRVQRGGCWLGDAERCRLSKRYYESPSERHSFDGIRLALSE